MAERGFAVIDFETTGLNPLRYDRAIEVAVVHLNLRGEITDSWDSLINPERDLGAQHIHRISTSDVAGAPTFDQIAGTLASLIEGRVLVAHNADFDLKFLEAEFSRAGRALPIKRADCLCTMKLASVFLPGSRRNLATCCQRYGIELVDAHRALADATATATLLARYREQAPGLELWDRTLRAAETLHWPDIVRGSARLARPATSSPMPEAEDHLLKRLAEDRREFVSDEQIRRYLASIDAALIHRNLSLPAQQALSRQAAAAQLDAVEVHSLHGAYFRSLVVDVVRKGHISASDRRLIADVGIFLHLDLAEMDEQLATAE